MVKESNITINVSKKTWKMLNDKKLKPSDTFDGIIKEILLQISVRAKE